MYANTFVLIISTFEANEDENHSENSRESSLNFHEARVPSS
jgi:hypothetical protein